MRMQEKTLEINQHIVLRIFGSENPRMRLICFPFSGGNSTHFRPLAGSIPDDWQLCAVDPPGHGQSSSPLCHDIHQLVSCYLSSLQPWLKGYFCIFGHSLGALIGYLLTRRLEEQQMGPQGLFISAMVPPHRLCDNFPEEPREIGFAFVQKNLGEIDEQYSAFVQKKGLLIYFLPLIKADYRVLKSYPPEKPPEKKLMTPMTVFYSTGDNLIASRYIPEWKQYGHMVELLEISGQHNYLMKNPGAISGAIVDLVKKTEGFGR